MAAGAGSTVDLGSLDGGPVVVFGGPVSNLQATRAVLARARELSIPAGRVICTGDVVAYCADPEETVRAVREAGIHVVMGNCEESLGAAADDCGCNFGAGSTCEVLAQSWYAYSVKCLSEHSREWMRGLPRRIGFSLGGRTLAAVHGAPSQINAWVFPSTSAEDKRRELDLVGTDGVIGGHSGLPFAETVDGRLWLNAGSVGLPANDGTPRGWYALLRAGDDGLAVELHALTYDHAAAAARMREAGLPEGYEAALRTGIWPSWDILPDAERARAGTPLPDVQRLHWARV
ncbi:metallophosphoesterase family protein [Ferruginivarius sediminum]|uniref:Metallophosphoesterase n=1 Tax=Ferruginivarius sediminum TaxID=2661937 RepID=A0A369TD73_9PROT|nr:metallophosphoesterase family protein [Ferruginivarius sediminum]RDD63301.1 metallophosphoesterase [Ferruginivarius sediminum]